MSPWLIYLVMQADSIHAVVKFLTFAGGVASVIFGLIALITSDRDNRAEERVNDGARTAFKRAIAAFLVCVSVWAFVPTTKTLLVVTGVSYVTQSEEMMKLPDNLARFVNGYLADLTAEPAK